MKKTPYFSHDSNARTDPKIVALKKKYGLKGYGQWWVLIEMLREQENYCLPCKEWAYEAVGAEINEEPTEAQGFITDLIKRFELLKTDEEKFWSESLNRRMELMEAKTEQAREAALKRWEKEKQKKQSGRNAAA